HPGNKRSVVILGSYPAWDFLDIFDLILETGVVDAADRTIVRGAYPVLAFGWFFEDVLQSLDAVHRRHFVNSLSNQLPLILAVGVGQDMALVVPEWGTRYSNGHSDVELLQHALKVTRPAIGHGGRSHGIFQHQVPAN